MQGAETAARCSCRCPVVAALTQERSACGAAKNHSMQGAHSMLAHGIAMPANLYLELELQLAHTWRFFWGAFVVVYMHSLILFVPDGPPQSNSHVLRPVPAHPPTPAKSESYTRPRWTCICRAQAGRQCSQGCVSVQAVFEDVIVLPGIRTAADAV